MLPILPLLEDTCESTSTCHRALSPQRAAACRSRQPQAQLSVLLAGACAGIFYSVESTPPYETKAVELEES